MQLNSLSGSVSFWTRSEWRGRDNIFRFFKWICHRPQVAQSALSPPFFSKLCISVNILLLEHFEPRPRRITWCVTNHGVPLSVIILIRKKKKFVECGLYVSLNLSVVILFVPHHLLSPTAMFSSTITWCGWNLNPNELKFSQIPDDVCRVTGASVNEIRQNSTQKRW